MRKFLIALGVVLSTVAYTQQKQTLTIDDGEIVIGKTTSTQEYRYKGSQVLFYNLNPDRKINVYFITKMNVITIDTALIYSYNGSVGTVAVDTVLAHLKVITTPASSGGGSGTAAWGTITGTLSAQSDLWAAIRYKQDSTKNPFKYSSTGIVVQRDSARRVGFGATPNLSKFLVAGNKTSDSLFKVTNSYLPVGNTFYDSTFYIGRRGSLFTAMDLYALNKARTGYVRIGARNAAGPETVWDLTNLGNVSLVSGSRLYLGGNATAPYLGTSGSAVTTSGGVTMNGVAAPTQVLLQNQSGTFSLGIAQSASTNVAGNAAIHGAAGRAGTANQNAGSTLIGSVSTGKGTTTGTGLSTLEGWRSWRATTSGSTENSVTPAFIVPSEKPLTDAGADSLYRFPLPANSSTGFSFTYTINVSDGTETQTLTGVVTVAMVRNSTTITSTITENASNQAYATSSGGATLVPTWSMVNWTTNNTVTLRLSANSSLTPTIMKIGYVITNYHSTSTATLTQL
jgi:hypothetical protein